LNFSPYEAISYESQIDLEHLFFSSGPVTKQGQAVVFWGENRTLKTALPDRVEISVRVAAGDWTMGKPGENAVYKEFTNLPNGKVIILSGLRPNPDKRVHTKTLIDATTTEFDVDIKLECMTRDKNHHKSWGEGTLTSKENLVQCTFGFRPAIENIEKIYVKYRDFSKVTFKNVSLRPGVKTDVQVEGEKPHPTKAAAKQGRKVYLPDLYVSRKILDLASGKLVAYPLFGEPLEKVHKAIREKGKGDLFYARNALAFLRGSQPDQYETIMESGIPCKIYRIGESFPQTIAVTTKEGRKYKIKILSADEKGCQLEYEPMDKTDVQVEGEPVDTYADNPRAAISAIIEQLKSAKYVHSGRGSADVVEVRSSSSYQSSTRTEKILDFRFEGDLSRSDAFTSEKGKRGDFECSWAVGPMSSVRYNADEKATVQARPFSRFYRRLGYDFHPETFPRMDQSSIVELLEGMARQPQVTLKVTQEPKDVVRVVSDYKNETSEQKLVILLINGADGMRLSSWEFTAKDSTEDGTGARRSSLGLKWRKYAGVWYISEAISEGAGVHDGLRSEGRSTVTIREFTPNVEIEDKEFTLDGLDIPPGARVNDLTLDTTYKYAGSKGDSAEKLRKLSRAAQMYANDYDNKFPGTIQQLKRFLDEKDLKWLSDNICYLGKGRTIHDLPEIPLAYDRTMFEAEQGKGTNVLFVSGIVSFRVREQLKKLGITAGPKTGVPVEARISESEAEKYEGKTIAEWIAQWDSKLYDDTRAATQALIRIGRPAVPAMIEQIKKRSNHGWRAVGVLSKMGPEAEDALELLIEMALDKDLRFGDGRQSPTAYRGSVLYSLSNMKWARQRVITVLQKIAEDGEEEAGVRQQVVWVLRRVGKGAMPILQKLTEDEERSVRDAAHSAIGQLLEKEEGLSKDDYYTPLIEKDPFDPSVPRYLENTRGIVNYGRPHLITQRIKKLYRERLAKEPDAQLAWRLATIIQNGLKNTELMWAAPAEGSKGRSPREDPTENYTTLAEVLQLGFDHAESGSQLQRQFGTSLAKLRLLQGDWDRMNAMLQKLGQEPIQKESRQWLHAPPEDWQEDLRSQWKIADESMRSGNCSLEFKIEKAGKGLKGVHILVKRAPEPTNGLYTGISIDTLFFAPTPMKVIFGSFGYKAKDRPMTRYAVSDETGIVRFDKLPNIPIKIEVLVPTSNFPEAASNWDLWMEVEPGKFKIAKMYGGADAVGRGKPPPVEELKQGQTVHYPKLVVSPAFSFNVGDWTRVDKDNFVLSWAPMDSATQAKTARCELEMFLSAPPGTSDRVTHAPVLQSAKIIVEGNRWPVGEKGVGKLRLEPGNIYVFEIRALDASGVVIARWPRTRVCTPWHHRTSDPPYASVPLFVRGDVSNRPPIHNRVWHYGSFDKGTRRRDGLREKVARFLSDSPDAFEYEYVRMGKAWLDWHDDRQSARRQLEQLVKELPKGNVARGTAVWLIQQIDENKEPPKRLNFVPDRETSRSKAVSLPDEKTDAQVEVEGTGEKNALAWGEEVDGLQLGLSYDSAERPYSQGEIVSFDVHARNNGNKAVDLSYVELFHWCPYARDVTDANDAISIVNVRLIRGDASAQEEHISLGPGDRQSLGKVALQIGPLPKGAQRAKYSADLEPGGHIVTQTGNFGGIGYDSWRGKLTTGELPLIVLPAQTSIGPPKTRGGISGVVVSSVTGKPIAGAYVGVGDFGDSGGSNYSRHREQGFHDKTKTDEKGRFELGGLVFTDKHRYLKYHPLVVTHPDFVRHDEKIELPSSGPVPDVKVSLRPAARIDVTVVNADGNPLKGHWLLRLEALDGRRFIPPGSDPHLSSFASSIWAHWPNLRENMGISQGFAFTELDSGQYSIEAIRFHLVDNPTPQNIWEPTITYHGAIPKIKIEAGQAKQVQLAPQDHQTRLTITPPEFPDKLMDKLERSSHMPLMCLISRSPGAMLWDDGKIHHLEDQRLGRIDQKRFFRGFFIQGKPLTINNLPPDSYSLFTMAIYGQVAGYLIGARADLAKGDKITVDIPWRQPTGPSMFGPNRSFDYPVKLEARDYSVSQLCEILTDTTQSNPRIIADSSIENVKLRFDKGELSVWDVLEKLYLDKGWKVDEGENKTLIIKPAENKVMQTDVEKPGTSTNIQMQPFSFGPVVECVVHTIDDEKNSFIDFDTGKFFSTPKKRWLLFDFDVRNFHHRFEWARKTGVDATVIYSEDSDLVMLWFYDVASKMVKSDNCLKVESVNWQDLRAEQIVQDLSKATHFVENDLGLGHLRLTPPGATRIFKTREGGVGVIQIVGLTDNPKGVKIRYKMVQKKSAGKTNVQVGALKGVS